MRKQAFSQMAQSMEAEQELRDRLAQKALTGYCRHIPQAVGEKVMSIYEHYGFWAAMEAAEAVVLLADMHR